MHIDVFVSIVSNRHFSGSLLAFGGVQDFLKNGTARPSPFSDLHSEVPWTCLHVLFASTK